MLSAFDFRRAVLAFRAASAAEAEGCVLCQWGEAMALGPNLNSFDEPRLLASIPSAFQKAQAALHLLERLEATPMRPSSIERGLVYALKHRYVPTAAEYVMNESQLTHSYAMEMDRLLADVKTTDANYANVAALTADALMNTCPWDYWVPGVPDPGHEDLEVGPDLEPQPPFLHPSLGSHHRSLSGSSPLAAGEAHGEKPAAADAGGTAFDPHELSHLDAHGGFPCSGSGQHVGNSDAEADLSHAQLGHPLLGLSHPGSFFVLPGCCQIAGTSGLEPGRKWNFRNGFPTRALRRGLAFDTLSLRPVPADLGRGATQAVPSGAVSGRHLALCRRRSGGPSGPTKGQ